MADTLHKLLPEKLVTKQNLIDENFSVSKKFVMVDSRAYTEEAFEYVLRLADIAGSIVFVYDTKKIWANGRYFGGDIFQEDLQYFTEFASVDENDVFTGIAQANHAKELIKFKGINHVKIKANYDAETGENSITFNYDLNEAVNSERVEIDGAKYNLVVENGQVKLNQYKPMVVTLSSLSPLEFDSTDEETTISLRLYISGTIPDPSLVDLQLNAITTNGDDITTNCVLDADTNTITATIPLNTDVKFTVAYSDGETSGVTSTWQRWGYSIMIGKFNSYYYDFHDIEDGVDFDSIYTNLKTEEGMLLREVIWVPGTIFNTSINIDCNPTDYGIIVCPYNMDLEFTDTSINLVGGWRPVFNITGMRYLNEHEREFIVWKTDHKGIGLINWKIRGEEVKNTEEIE